MMGYEVSYRRDSGEDSDDSITSDESHRTIDFSWTHNVFETKTNTKEVQKKSAEWKAGLNDGRRRKINFNINYVHNCLHRQYFIGKHLQRTKQEQEKPFNEPGIESAG